MEAIKYSIVIPVYKNEQSLPELIANLTDTASRLDGPLEVVFVVDASPDASWQVLRRLLPEASFQSRLILLSRNFGSFSAVTAGLSAARGEYCCVIAADLQEPADIPERFFKELNTGAWDVVVGRRRSRSDPWFDRLMSSLFWGFYRRFVQPEVPRGGVDVFACNRAVCDVLTELKESNTSLIGLLFWIGFRRTTVEYVRHVRKYGRSAWNFRRRIRYLKDSVFGFTDLPIRLLGVAGVLGLITALVVALDVTYERLTHQVEVPGYAAVMVAVLFFGGLNSLGISVLGEYLWRSFENSKHRPRFIVLRSEQFQPSEMPEVMV